MSCSNSGFTNDNNRYFCASYLVCTIPTLCPSHSRQMPVAAGMLGPRAATRLSCSHTASAAVRPDCGSSWSARLCCPLWTFHTVPIWFLWSQAVSRLSHTWLIIVMQWYERAVLCNNSKNPLDSALIDPWTTKTGFGNLAKNKPGRLVLPGVSVGCATTRCPRRPGKWKKNMWVASLLCLLAEPGGGWEQVGVSAS